MSVLQEAEEKMRQSFASLRALQVSFYPRITVLYVTVLIRWFSRMNRACDYSDAAPPPTSDDFNALKMKVLQLEANLQGRHNHQTLYTPATSNGIGPETIGHQIPTFNPTQDISWQGVQNRFPAIAFLDGDTFKYGG